MRASRFFVGAALACLVALIASGCNNYDGGAGGCSVTEFTIVTIDGSTAATCRPGDTIIIEGSFSSDVGVVRFSQGLVDDDIYAQSWSTSTIIVTVPSSLTIGEVTVNPMTHSYCGISGETFTTTTVTIQ
jgi:hypothetical protein